MSESGDLEGTARVLEEPGDADVPAPWIVAVLLRERRLILISIVVGAVIGGVIALTKKEYYTSTFSFIPQSGDDQGRSGLAAIAGQFGISVGGIGGSSQPPQLYADLLATRGVLATIARDSVTDDQRAGKRIPLSEFLEVKGESGPIVQETTIRKLRKEIVNTSVATHTTGVVTVSARTRSPRASLEIAQKLLDGVNRFNVETRKSQAAAERRFTEGRLEAEKTALRAAEDALQRFLQGNRQFGTASELSFQKDRLQREVSLHQMVVQGLSQQYEDARIREVRDTPVISIIEQPTIPVLPDPRGRVLSVMLLTFVATFFAAAFVIAREGWNRQRRGSANASYELLANEWRGVRESFRKS